MKCLLNVTTSTDLIEKNCRNRLLFLLLNIKDHKALLCGFDTNLRHR